MTIPRRQFLRIAAGAVALPAVPHMAQAKSYPSRPVRLLVGFAGGATNDTLARLVGQWLSGRLGQSFIIENRPGAGGNIATEMAVRAPADGYTLLMAPASSAINATLYEKLTFNFLDDIAPVASLIRQPYLMVLNSSVPAKTVLEFIAHAKANPGKINMASGGVGTGPHVAGELFKLMAGVDMVHVPYRGGAPALTDLLAGQVQVMFPAPAAAIAYVRAGTLRPLAATSATRWEGLPDIPTLGEFVQGYEASTWFGICAPRGTPAEIVDKLNREINIGLADPKMMARLADLGGGIYATSPAAFGRHIADETEKWGKVVRAINIRM